MNWFKMCWIAYGIFVFGIIIFLSHTFITVELRNKECCIQLNMIDKWKSFEDSCFADMVGYGKYNCCYRKIVLNDEGYYENIRKCVAMVE